jgi:hypothetical protein
MNTPVTTTIRTRLSIVSMTAMLAAVAPTTSRADARSDAAMNSCIDLFVAANLPKEQPVVIRKVEPAPGPAPAHRRVERVILTAQGATSGKTIAKATCTIDEDGQIIALNGKTITAAQLAAAAARETTLR